MPPARHPLSPLRVTAAHARRFQRRAVLLDAPVADVGAALAHHAYVQIDPINVCGRMHDLMLRNRVAGYREGDLMRHLHGDGALTPDARVAFEHFIPYPGVLAAFEVDAWSRLGRAMRWRGAREDAWSGRLTGDERALAKKLLRDIERRGPSSSDDFDDARRTTAAWGPATLVKHVLQKLFFHGRLLVARRGAGQRRVYDLPERVLPRRVIDTAPVSDDEALRWEALLRIRQRRLVQFKRAELARVGDVVREVVVDDALTLHCLRDDEGLFDLTAAEPVARPSPMLLAPLDPLVYDRRVTASLWGFDYTWEVYTPPAKRVRGYYALPVLSGDALVGHVDPKADRDKGRLQVMRRAVKRGHKVADALEELARFLGLTR